MKVWEYIKNNFNDTRNMSEENIKDKVIDYNMTPCQAERKYKIVSGNLRKFKKQMNCNEDCLNCSRKYLNMEVEEDKK